MSEGARKESLARGRRRPAGPLQIPQLAALLGKPAVADTRRQFWKVLSVCLVHPPIPRGLQGPAGSGFGQLPWGSWGKEGVLGRVVGRGWPHPEGRGGCQRGLPVGAASGRLEPEGSQEETWAHPAPACTPSKPLPPTSLQTPRTKGRSWKGCADGGRLGPRLRMWPPSSSGQEDATPDTDRHLGGSWVQELGSAQAAQDRRAEPRCSAELSPRAETESPLEPPIFQK